jgi:hypothetical protein
MSRVVISACPMFASEIGGDAVVTESLDSQEPPAGPAKDEDLAPGRRIAGTRSRSPSILTKRGVASTSPYTSEA